MPARRRGSQRPGTYFLYSNWDFNALGTVFERETGRNIYDALESDLARPIGMQDFQRSAQVKTGDTTRSVHRAYHMNLSTRDMARLGHLMLREGRWAGRQVVPADWVRETTRAFTPVTQMNPDRLRSGPFGYGYLWWVWDGPHATGPYRGAYAGWRTGTGRWASTPRASPATRPIRTYRDLFELWATDRFFPAFYTRPRVDSVAGRVTILAPAP